MLVVTLRRFLRKVKTEQLRWSLVTNILVIGAVPPPCPVVITTKASHPRQSPGNSQCKEQNISLSKTYIVSTLRSHTAAGKSVDC